MSIVVVEILIVLALFVANKMTVNGSFASYVIRGHAFIRGLSSEL
jgi:hypothetical protein